MAVANGTTYGYLKPNPFSANAFVCHPLSRRSASQEVRDAS
ncbi:hypothetical protein UYSO10_2188 [Kosakonia radicincitans]|nr:hypothetical protein UYSO10_2188 [Kosakonia radicincitans]